MKREIIGFFGFLCMECGIWMFSPRLSLVVGGLLTMLAAAVLAGPSEPTNRPTGRK